MGQFLINGHQDDPEATPRESWWLDRDQFYARAKQRHPHMRNSTFGRWNISLDGATGWVENRGDGLSKRAKDTPK